MASNAKVVDLSLEIKEANKFRLGQAGGNCGRRIR